MGSPLGKTHMSLKVDFQYGTIFRLFKAHLTTAIIFFGENGTWHVVLFVQLTPLTNKTELGTILLIQLEIEYLSD